MHEAAIIQGVLEIAESEARKRGATCIRKIKLRIGEFRGVVSEALKFAFDALKQDTLARDAELEVENIRLHVKCHGCSDIDCSISNFSLLCPKCGHFLTIVAGREMQIEYIDLD